MPFYIKVSSTLVLSFLPLFSNAQTCKTGSIPATTPSSQFTINNNGTVVDSKTGLMWKKCAEGQTGNDCRGGAETYFWHYALNQAKSVNESGGFAGFKDWRVPNMKELKTIVEKQCTQPAINTVVFPNTSDWFWSSSAVTVPDARLAWNDFKYSTLAWSIDFDYTHSHAYNKSSTLHVRLVRGGRRQ